MQLQEQTQCMKDSDYRENLRNSLQNALKHNTVSAIARGVGCAPSSISTFLRSGPLGSKYRLSLESWLRDSGYWIPEEPVIAREEAAPYSIRHAMASEFRSAADVLDSELPDRIVATRIASLITLWNDSYQEARERLKREERYDDPDTLQ
jgi:hypothetical protein